MIPLSLRLILVENDANLVRMLSTTIKIRIARLKVAKFKNNPIAISSIFFTIASMKFEAMRYFAFL